MKSPRKRQGGDTSRAASFDSNRFYINNNKTNGTHQEAS